MKWETTRQGGGEVERLFRGRERAENEEKEF